jgi:DedD protein
MADRFAEPDDAAVDELKRKARRRLVGAIVLALAAAIVVPMLLEREPRSLGDEVSVQIPPVDEGRFVNRLTESQSGTPAKAPPKSEAAPPAREPTRTAPSSATPATPSGSTAGAPSAPSKAIADAEHRALAPPVQPTPPAAPPVDSTAAAAAEPKPAPPPNPPSAAAKSEPAKPESVASASPPSTSAVPPSSVANGQGFVVQLAAFADDKGANALAGKLKRAGYPAYTEPVTTSRGTLWRVRVGAYPSKDAASAARNRLKGDGYSGIVASAN